MGGDGFCGWPTSLHLSKHGHEILIVDNLSRRDIDIELGASSLTPIKSINERIQSWKKISNKCIEFSNFDIAKDYDYLFDAGAVAVFGPGTKISEAAIQILQILIDSVE